MHTCNCPFKHKYQIFKSSTNGSTLGGSKDSVTLQGAIYHKQKLKIKNLSYLRGYTVSETDICKLIIMSNLPLQIDIKSPHWRSIQLTGTCQIWDSHSGVYEVLSLLGYNCSDWYIVTNVLDELPASIIWVMLLKFSSHTPQTHLATSYSPVLPSLSPHTCNFHLCTTVAPPTAMN